MTENSGSAPKLTRSGRVATSSALAACLVSLCGCYSMRSSAGGGDIDEPPPPRGRRVTPADVAVPPGYRVEAIATGLTFPTGVDFDDAGNVYVTESGYSYDEVFTTPRLLRVERGGRTRVIAAGDNGPWTGLAFHRGAFYVAEGGAKAGGRISRITADGEITVLLDDLPSFGDHHTNGPVVGPDGMLYFGQGVATNSAVVGEDNHAFGWLKRHPEFHDVPCKDITLRGTNFTTKNPLTPNEADEVETGAFSPFGTPTEAGQVIRGQVPCSGAILRIPPEGGQPELVAWGLRNPFGLAFSPDGRLFVTENSFDVRGSRPFWGAGDYLWEIRTGLWYGWPDYAGGEPAWTERFKVPTRDASPPLLAALPNTPPKPVARFGVHSSADGIDFSRSPAFGYVGEAFVAEFGDMAPKVGKVLAPVGFRVVRVNVSTGVIQGFVTNKGPSNGPASLLESGGLERPVAVRFDRAGAALYVVDFGVMKVTEDITKSGKGTGVLWRVTRVGGGQG